MRRSILAIATVATSLAAVPAFSQTPADPAAIVPDGTLLEVTAEGRTTQVPDLATIDAGVVTQAPTAAAALADNAVRMDKVLAALRGAGVDKRDIATAAVRLNPQYRYTDNQPPAITGYQATNTVSVKFHDIAKSGTILDALVQQGANQIDGPNLTLANPDTALDAARTDAVRRAMARAKLYAAATGLSVARIVSIDEAGANAGGSPPPRPMMQMRAEAAPKTQIEPGETDVTATVTVRFLLK